MTYLEAVECKKRNQNLIGTSDRGCKVGKIIIVPSNEEDRDKFLSSYLRTYDDASAIIPYVNDSVEVWAIDLDFLYCNNVLLHERLS